MKKQEQQQTARKYESYDAIVFEPVILKLTKNPKVHAIIGEGFPFWVRLEVGEELPDTVPAVALVDGMSCFGVVPTASIGIGLKTEQTKFEAGQ